MTVVVVVLFILGCIVSTAIVNGFEQLIMRWLNLSTMFINVKVKVITIIVIGYGITSGILSIFGINLY